MRGHITAIGWAHIILNGIHLLIGLFALVIMGLIGGAAAASSNAHDAAPLAVFGGIGVIVFMIFAVISIPGMIVGWGLITFQPWARVGGIIMSALELTAFPLGTVLGVLGLMALCDPNAAALFEKPQYRQYP